MADRKEYCDVAFIYCGARIQCSTALAWGYIPLDASDVLVNDVGSSLAGWEGRRLLDFLRDGLGLTGAKEGCGEGECGACTVLIDDEPFCSCLVLTDTVRGRRVVTVEGIAPELLDELASAFDEEGGVQCGFCTPGFCVMAQWLQQGHPGSPRRAVSKLLEGNLCRCTGYVQLERILSRLVDRAAPETP